MTIYATAPVGVNSGMPLVKNHWKFEFNRGHDFQAYDDYGRPYATRWKHLNFSGLLQHTTRRHRGEQGLYETMSYRLFNLFGVPASKTNFLQLRVVDQPQETGGDQYGGDFWGLYLAIENMDGRFLDEHDLPDGNLYDMKGWTGELDHQGAGAPGNKADLNYFLGAYSNGSPDTNWWRQNFDLDGYFRFRAVLEAVHSYDVDQGKNYYLFANSDTQRWSILPWDQDLTWTEDYFGEGAEPFRDRVLPHWEFNIQYQNTLRELRALLFNPEQIFPMIDEVANLIDTPAGGNSMVDADRAMWDFHPMLQSRYVVEARSLPGKFYQQAPGSTFRGMTSVMREYLLRRTAWIDQTLLTDNNQPYTPAVRYSGPANYPADRLIFATSGYADPQGANTFAGMQWRTAEIVMPGRPGYDPNRPSRYEAEATWVSPVLTTYTPSMTLPRGVCRPGYNCRVRVRMLDNTGRWSHWSSPFEFTTSAPVLGPTRELRVSEVMYHPGPVRNLPSAELEFVELTNAGSAPLDLSNLRFTAGIDYVFPVGTMLAPGAHVVLANSADYFQDRYGFAPFDAYGRDLSNKGEQLTLVDAFGATVLSFSYSDADGWPAAADGAGPSLVAATANESGDPNQAAYWRASTGDGGSLGADDPLPVLINEIQTAPDTGIIEAVDPLNPSAQPAPVGNWVLATIHQATPQDRDAVPAGQHLAGDAVVPPGGYLVVETRDQLPILRVPAGGGALSLYATGDGGRLSGYKHGGTFDAPGDATIGRFVSADGGEHFVREEQPSLRNQNGSPRIGPLVINRILLRSPNGVQGVELVNISDKTVELYDPSDLSRTWILGGAVFKLPAGIKLAPGRRLRIVNRTPADVCMQNGESGGTPITGPLMMPLTEGGVDLTILQPIPFAGVATYTASDRVRYRNHGPWPPLAGSVVTLQRRSLNGFGDDAMNWDVVPTNFTENADAFTASAETIDLCTFDAFPAEAGVRVEWVAPALSPGAKFQLIRTRVDDLHTPEMTAEIAAPKQSPDSAGPTRFEWVDQTAAPIRNTLISYASLSPVAPPRILR
ncbi:MAG: CotH kinase family protein [Anaerolineales bacterium]|nr:CotH kinase family protein [Anaerolineales bacterium]